jgi:hypothetical protein
MAVLDDRATTLSIYPPDDPHVTTWTYTPGAPARIELGPWPKLRLFGGQPDPADPSRFTIPYEVGGKPGIIHGRLKDDDTVELRPSTGKVVGDRWTPDGQ